MMILINKLYNNLKKIVDADVYLIKTDGNKNYGTKHLVEHYYESSLYFSTNMASTFQLATMILPQLEKNTHGVEVVGMFFFDENAHIKKRK